MPHVPVTMGSPRFRSAEAGSCTIIDAWFPPGAVLPPHTHDRPIFGVMLAGAFQSEIAHRRLDCPRAAVWVEPAAERHANFVGREGARVLVVQPDVAGAEHYAPFAALLDRVAHLRDASIAAEALRVRRELDEPDDLSPLAITGGVLAMLVSAARASGRDRYRPAPAWLDTVREMLHAHFRERVELGALAAAAGVHPAHLARAFRAHTRQSLGEYVRRLRVTWVAEQLRGTDRPLAEVAVDAGFHDQSHLTREFRRQLGQSPAQFRRAGRGRGRPAPDDTARR